VFQADTMLAHLLINDEIDFIVSVDTDFLMYLPLEYFFISYIKFPQKNQPETILEIKGTRNSVMCQMRGLLHTQNKSIVFYESKEPIFDYGDHVLRSLCAIFLGCDVFPSGVQNLGCFSHLLLLMNLLSLKRKKTNKGLAISERKTTNTSEV